jgi:hypothetical protein
MWKSASGKRSNILRSPGESPSENLVGVQGGWRTRPWFARRRGIHRRRRRLSAPGYTQMTKKSLCVTSRFFESLAIVT